MKKVFLSLILLLGCFSIIKAQTYQYIIYPDQDAVLKKQDGTNYENTNYGSSTDFTANYEDVSGQYLTERSLMDFDLSTVPSGSNIANVYLHLDGINHTSGSNDATVTIVASSWDESTVTWNNAPSTGSQYSVITQSTSSGEDYVIDVTSIITEMHTYPGTSYGILLKLDNESSIGRLDFASSDNTTQGVKAPKLVVNLVTPTLTLNLDEAASKLYTTGSDGSIEIDVSGGAVPYTYSWTPGPYTTQDLSSLSSGTYYLTLTDLVGNSKALTVKVLDDAAQNWSYAKSLDFDGNILSESKEYRDLLNRTHQVMSKDYETGLIIGNQTIYDAHGRAAIQTLAAPMGYQLAKKSGFIQNTSGVDYSYSDFDLSTNINSPTGVKQSTNNTLGNYYSDDGQEDFIATSSYPYLRTVYTNDPTGRVSHSAMAGDELRMGKGKESRVLYYTAYDELIPIFGTSKSYKVKQDPNDRMAYIPLNIGPSLTLRKTIHIDPDGLRIVTYTDLEGKTIATAIVGDASSGAEAINVNSRISFESNGTSSEIHIPAETDDSVRLVLPDYISSYTNGEPNNSTASHSDVSYELYDVVGDKVLVSGTDYTLNSSTRYLTFTGNYAANDKFLRIKAILSTSFVSATLSNGGVLPTFNRVSYILNYKNWSLNYYDLAGRLRMSVSPEGYVKGGSHAMYTTFDYDPFGNLIASKDPDYGLTETVYDKERRIRFSQNAKQKDTSYFSYVNYDDIGRVLETGEYRSEGGSMVFQNYYEDYSITGSDTSVLTSLNSSDGLNDAKCNEQSFYAYYKLDNADEINSTSSSYAYKTYYSSYYRPFSLSKSWNDNHISWYGYNKLGQLTYHVQQITESDFVAKTAGIDDQIKTLDFTYDSDNGRLTKKEYQKREPSDMLTYNYSYNNNGQLKSVVVEDNSNDNLASASFEYYLNGQLKRKVLGDNLQGIDYVYTINGQLKSINHPSLSESNDPGGDGGSSGDNMLVDRDLFGFTIDYFPNDYSRTGSNIESSVTSGNGLYAGLKKAKRWRIRDKNQINGTSNLYTESGSDKEVMYEYSYDMLGRLGKALFGVYDNSANTFTSQEDYALWGETESSNKRKISYDLNGNIEKLQRNGYDLGGENYAMDDLDYNYHSTKLNSLSSVLDNVSSSSYTDDFETSGTDNFTYDEIGQLTSSDAEGVSSIVYSSSGKVLEVHYSGGDKVYYSYDAADNKIKSQFYDSSATPINKFTWYVRDESGSVVSIYECDETNPTCSADLTQQPLNAGGAFATNFNGTVLYSLTDDIANERVAFKEKTGTMKYSSSFTSSVDGWESFDGSTLSYTSGKLKVEDTQSGSGAYKAVSLTSGENYEFSFTVDMGTSTKLTYIVTTCSSCTTSYSTPISVTSSGTYKMSFSPTQTGNSYLIIYEDSNASSYDFELSNVRVEERDRVTIENWHDYYPFGEVMPGRNGQSSYYSAYGFKGQEKSENERWVDFKLRMYNPSLGRWISPDPYHQDASPYAAMGNNPVSNVDPDGGWYYDPSRYTAKGRYDALQRTKYILSHRGYDEFGNYHYSDGGSNWRRSTRYKKDMELVTGLKMAWFVDINNGLIDQSDAFYGTSAPQSGYYGDNYSFERGEFQIDWRTGGPNPKENPMAFHENGSNDYLESQMMVSIVMLGAKGDLGSFDPSTNDTRLESGGIDLIAMANDPTFGYPGPGLSFIHDFWSSGEADTRGSLNKKVEPDKSNDFVPCDFVFLNENGVMYGADGEEFVNDDNTTNTPNNLKKSSMKLKAFGKNSSDPNSYYTNTNSTWKKVPFRGDLSSDRKLKGAYQRASNLVPEGHNFIVIVRNPMIRESETVFGVTRVQSQEIYYIDTGINGARFINGDYEE